MTVEGKRKPSKAAEMPLNLISKQFLSLSYKFLPERSNTCLASRGDLDKEERSWHDR